jgi:hypothetical protein
MKNNPYHFAPTRALWSRAISRGWHPADVINGSAPLIRHGEAVVSAGSCFASNIVPYLEEAGMTYLRTETPHPAFEEEGTEALGYGRFSAAYGNIYTVRQLRQLLQRGLGLFSPKEDRWHIDGAVIDPFRPGLRYPARSDVEFDAIRVQHLARVREAFSRADVFVFTLGLTEAWVSRVDGAVFPACPGTVAGNYDPACHAFVNFSVSEVVDDFDRFIKLIRQINQSVRFIITVSPVPLVATASENHVLSATIYSKSVLRVAAEEICLKNNDVSYFPAYEIVTGPQAPDTFFEHDRRSVSTEAIRVVMSTLLSRCLISTNIQYSALNHKVPVTTPSLSRNIVEAECEEAMSDPNWRESSVLPSVSFTKGR